MDSLKLLTGSEAVELFGVSERTINYAKAALKHGWPALRAALESGLISVWGAARLTDHCDASVQNWVVAKTNRHDIRRRLRMARQDADAVARLAKRDPDADETPRGARIPQIRSVAVAAARAAARTWSRS
jgi:hypothetical protein